MGRITKGSNPEMDRSFLKHGVKTGSTIRWYLFSNLRVAIDPCMKRI